MVAVVLAVHMAQSQTPTTAVATPNQVTCPSGEGLSPHAVCYQSSITCGGLSPLSVWYAVTPATVTQVGTIVLFNGAGGDTGPYGVNYVPSYIAKGYQTVQVVWGTISPLTEVPWELGDSGTAPWSIKTAACRPAAVLQYMFNTYESGGTGNPPLGAMCAQGASAGGAAVAYALAEYGAGSYLDNAEFTSGPPLADLAAGCAPPFSSATVCSGSTCQTGGEGSWPDSPEYVLGAEHCIDQWTGLASETSDCSMSTATAVCTNTTTYRTQWKDMSVVDGESDSTFSYPDTTMSGWLCSNTSVTCTGSSCSTCTGSACQNNSAVEGYDFFIHVSTSHTVYRVDQCTGTEGVDGVEATVPALSESGLTAITNDMEANCSPRHGSVRKGN
jgi:hypothetical protein